MLGWCVTTQLNSWSLLAVVVDDDDRDAIGEKAGDLALENVDDICVAVAGGGGQDGIVTGLLFSML